MQFMFATCERHRALQFLRALHPTVEMHDSPESCKDILDIIEADELRVADPAFHAGQMVAGKNMKPDTIERAMVAMTKAGIVFGTHPDREKH